MDGVPGNRRGRKRPIHLFLGSRTIEIVNGVASAVALILVPEILEQVTVTADRTGERELQKVPLAVSVLSNAQLTRREVHSIGDLTGLAPGLRVAHNTGFSQLSIWNRKQCGVHRLRSEHGRVHDGVYVARPAAVLTEFGDLDRVEVLRGPQGTLSSRACGGGSERGERQKALNETDAFSKAALRNRTSPECHTPDP
jgi:iron complex outermembrane receptor protein